MSTLLPTFLLAAAAWAAPDDPASDPVLVDHRGTVITVALIAPEVQPGAVVGVYVAEPRPDPRTGAPVEGLRFAGDGRVVWVGPDLVEIALEHPDQPLAVDARVVLGDPRGDPPTPPWTAPEPEPAAEPEPPAVVVVPIEPDPAPEVQAPRRARRVVATIVGPWRDHYGRSQALRTELDWSDDGYGTGIGALAVGWSWVPERRLGRVDVRLEGLRGSRWVASDGGGKREPWAREPAVGYWLWTAVEGPAVALAPELGLAIGVQESGPTAGLQLGLRSGLPHAGHVRLRYARYGALGDRWTLVGVVPLSDRVRVGPRVRIGALPLHDAPDPVWTLEEHGSWRQQRADGTLRATWDASDTLSLTLGGGLSAYDLLFADAGPVLDTALEVRW